MIKMKAGLFAAALTVVALLFGSANCERLFSEAHAAFASSASMEAQTTDHSDSEPEIFAVGHCQDDQGGQSSHCAVHCHHVSALVSAGSALGIASAFVRVLATDSSFASRSLNPSLRPPIFS
jgi:hypothetical protein